MAMRAGPAFAVSTGVLLGACGLVRYDELAIRADAAPDADASRVIPTITCDTSAEPVLASVPGVRYREPALYIDGTTLLARPQGPNVEQATRTTPTAMFGDFGPATVIESDIQDPTFHDVSNLDLGFDLLAMGARLSGDRRSLLACIDPPMVACEFVEVYDAGSLMDDDLDGPTIVNRDGELLMAFSRSGAIYFASPRSVDLGQWDAVLFDVGTEVIADDPAFTSDGSMLVVPLNVAGSDGLYVYFWNLTTSTYDSRTRIAEGFFGSPSVGIETSGSIEFFFHRNTRGVDEPHQLVCTRTP